MANARQLDANEHTFGDLLSASETHKDMCKAMATSFAVTVKRLRRGQRAHLHAVELHRPLRSSLPRTRRQVGAQLRADSAANPDGMRARGQSMAVYRDSTFGGETSIEALQEESRRKSRSGLSVLDGSTWTGYSARTTWLTRTP